MVSSHILEELYKIADTFGIIHEGRLLEEISREELSDRCSDYLEIAVSDAGAACTVIERAGIHSYKVLEHHKIHIYETVCNPGELNLALVKAGVMVDALHTVQETLENYFLKLTGGISHD